MDSPKIAPRFGVVRELGRGGMGIVYLVRDSGSGREVALKALVRRRFSEPALRHFEQEFRTLTELTHPHLTEVYDFGRARFEDGPEESPYFTMEFVPGVTSDRYAREHGTGIVALAPVLAPVGQALAYLHAKGLVHQDVKPSNILVNPADGDVPPAVKLMDLGLAGKPTEGPGPGVLRGTAAYVSPESVRGDAVDPRSDLYSLGCTIYELLTGRPPFRGGSMLEVLRCHVGETPLPPSTLDPSVPPELDRLVLRLLEKDPGLRYPGVPAFLEALAEIGGDAVAVETPAIRRDRALGGGFFGRTSELETLRDAVVSSSDGHGRIVLIEGDAGIGKSRLLRQFQVECQLDGRDVHVGRPDTGGVLDAFRRAVSARSGGAATVPAEHRQIVDGIARADGSTEGLDRVRLHAAVAETLRGLGRDKGLVIALEDIHRLGEGDGALLSFLARAFEHAGADAGGIVVVGTYRDAEVHRRSPIYDVLTEMRESGVCEDVTLGPLGPDETRSLLRSMIGADPPLEFVQRVHDETRGNPLHVEELVALLAEDGVVAPGTGTAPSADALDGVELPGKVRALLERRLGTVPDAALRVLHAAAVLGDDAVDPDAVAAVTGGRWEAVLRDVLELHRLGLVEREDRPGDAPVYRFARRGLIELAVASLAPEAAEALHAKAASYRERRGIPRSSAAWTRFATHAEHGGFPGRALEAWTRAGDLAREAHSHRDAVACFGRAIDLSHRGPATPTAVVCELYERRAESRAAIGEVALAEEDFRWMLARATKGESDPERARAHLGLGRVAALASRVTEGREHLEVAIEVADRTGLADTGARARYELGRLCGRAGDYDEAIGLIERAIEIADTESNAALRVAGLVGLGEIHRDHGDYRRSLERFREAAELADSTRTPELESTIHEGAALALEVQGRYGDAVDALERARRGARDRGDVRAIASLSTHLGHVRVTTGDTNGAARDLDEAIAIYRRIGSRDGVLRNLLETSRMQAFRGRYEAALESADEALHLARRSPRRERRVDALRQIAEIHLHLGDVERAQHGLAEAERVAGDETSPRAAAALQIAVGDLAERHDDIERARRAWQEAAFLARRVGDRQLEADALCRLGEAHLRSNEHDRARVACRKALARIDDAGLPRMEAVARLLRARIELTAPGGEIARSEADALAALDGFRRLGEPEGLWQAEHVAARAALRLGRSEEAAERIDRAYRFLERARTRLDDRWQDAFLAGRRRRELYDDRERLGEARPKAPEDKEPEGEFATLRAEVDSLRRILDLNHTLNSSRDVTRQLSELLDTALAITGAERGYLLEREGTEIVRLDPAGDGAPAEVLDISRSIATRVIETGEPIVSTDAGRDTDLSSFESVHDLRIRSVLAVPLTMRDEVIGALYLDSRLDRRGFSAHHLDMIRVLGAQAGLAIDSARLVSRIEEQNRHLARLNKELEQTVASQREELDHVRDELTSSRTSFELRYRFENMIGASHAMQRVYHLIDRLAPKRLPVLIHGESGTGKELIARALHTRSDRAEGPFFTVNCAALTATLLESELFGYRKGAFTGADRDKPGYFELASRGTLFLDEIGEMGAEMQAKLLRVLERGEVLPVGGKAPVQVDVRIVAATHRDLVAMIAERAFREDLYYRINVGRITIPPLRERKEDIALLVDHFLTTLAEEEGQRKSEIEPAALRRIGRHDWPGNVRELQHHILRVSTFAKGDRITLKDIERYGDLPEPGQGTASPAETGPVASLEETEKLQILRALEEAGGNRTRAAEILGINRATLFRKIKRLELNPD